MRFTDYMTTKAVLKSVVESGIKITQSSTVESVSVDLREWATLVHPYCDTNRAIILAEIKRNPSKYAKDLLGAT